MVERIDEAAAAFEPLRRYLTGIAYRMLGSVSEAQDMVQEAYIRWHDVDRSAVTDPKPFLAKTVTRLCLDHLKSARSKRESYYGEWLPEPVLEQTVDGPDAILGRIEDVSVALMLALERLSPLERAAFILHDVFDMDFDEVAEVLGRTEVACRQLAARGRKHVRDNRPRFTVDADEGMRIARAFMMAAQKGDTAALQSLLAEDVRLHTDGGGIKAATLNIILGLAKVARFFAGIAKKAQAAIYSDLIYEGTINGHPGFVTIESGDTLQSTALDVRDGKIVAIYIVRNPEKLSHIKIDELRRGA
ncbi:sigma-70 family RNA polymerase sigma factor [Lacibacterium aquatile]|uniref:Sigma-70 family RNA polymerase sigma factor n=1 Tax=Lacibacterium aquatile TaxID=1168082 RepID=A0ABW5DKG4_9PROT